MNLLERFEQSQAKSRFPAFQIGDAVKVHLKVLEGEGGEGGKGSKGGKEGPKEGKERIQIFEGVVIARKGATVRETFTVRKISYGVGVERVFSLHSPVIAKLEVGRRGRVKRAKLYYLRQLKGRASRLAEQSEAGPAPHTTDKTAKGPAPAATTGAGARAG